MKIMYTNKWKIPFMIDDEDEERVSKRCWYISHEYVTTHLEGTIALHIFLFGFAQYGKEWDHIDRNKLNNQRKNLRLGPCFVNRFNTGLWAHNTSGFKGVEKLYDRYGIHVGWKARINVDHKQRSKNCKTIEEAVAFRASFEKEAMEEGVQ